MGQIDTNKLDELIKVIHNKLDEVRGDIYDVSSPEDLEELIYKISVAQDYIDEIEDIVE